LQARTPCLDAVIPPRNQIERRLVVIWERVLKISPVGVRDDFFDLGGTSAMALTLFAEIEKEFGCALPMAEFYAWPLVEHLAKLIDAPDASARWDAVIALNAQGACPPLFFVPGLGGHAFDLRALAKEIGPQQPVYVLHPQGLDPNQVPLTSVQEMAAAFIKHVRAIQPEGPYRLGGYSFGGSVAYEMACQLHAAGESVALLALLDAYSPRAFQKLPFPRRAIAHLKRVWQYGRRRINGLFQNHIGSVWQRMNRAAMGGTAMPYGEPASVIFHAIQRVTDANGLAWRNYRPQPYPGKLVLFRAAPSDHALREFSVSDPQNGWGFYAAGGVDVIELSCDHLQVFHKPHLQMLAGKMRKCLDAVAGEKRPNRISA
jgi:thioesterase domain-containing protein/acyl carrier protein